jgi:hypothetical protein
MKTTGAPKYYDIPEESHVWQLLSQYWLKLTDRTQKKDRNFWQYQSRKIFKKSGIELHGGLINHLRICKAKYIESLPIDIKEKCIIHNRMCHNYETTINWYL